jgi:predicted ester cyclase
MKPLFITLAAALVACATTSNPAARNPPMTAEANKQVVRRIYEDCINPDRPDRLAELVSADYVGPRGERGPDGFAANVASLRAGFPDIKFTLDDLIADGDRVTVRWTWHAIHAGTFRGPAGSFPPTGKQVTNTAIAIYQLVDHKIVRVWLESDRLGALQQIGAVPATLSGSAGGPAAPAPSHP